MILERLKSNQKYLEHPGESVDFQNEKWAALFLNMGGPEKLDDVEQYLYNIFSDPYIIKLPLSFILQKPLARLISSRRAPKSRANYEAIGGGSPLLKWSRIAAENTEKKLKDNYPQIASYIGMRYTPPFIPDQLDRIAGTGVKHIVVVSLYPHYCRATTGTALREIIGWLDGKGKKHDVTISVISEWYDHPQYIDLLNHRIVQTMNKTDDPRSAKLLFSAHSLPVKMIEQGDPYLEQVKKTAALAAGDFEYILSFQSRSGPVRWQGPETAATVRDMGKLGVKELVVVPVSFVSDHIETLHEIDIELRELAAASGIKNFMRIESFNDDPRFIGLLADMIRDKITGGHK